MSSPPGSQPSARHHPATQMHTRHAVPRLGGNGLRQPFAPGTRLPLTRARPEPGEQATSVTPGAPVHLVCDLTTFAPDLYLLWVQNTYKVITRETVSDGVNSRSGDELTQYRHLRQRERSLTPARLGANLHFANILTRQDYPFVAACPGGRPRPPAVGAAAGADRRRPGAARRARGGDAISAAYQEAGWAIAR